MSLVITTGCFDILHRGHLQLLRFAKNEICKDAVVIVLIDSDERVRETKGPERPVNSWPDRMFFLKSLKYVDDVVVFDTDEKKEKIIRSLKPSYFLKGGDYNRDSITEKKILEEIGCTPIFFDYISGYSTTKFINNLRK